MDIYLKVELRRYLKLWVSISYKVCAVFWHFCCGSVRKKGHILPSPLGRAGLFLQGSELWVWLGKSRPPAVPRPLPPLMNEVLQGSSSVSAGLNISGHNQFSLSVSLLYLITNAFFSKFHFI